MLLLRDSSRHSAAGPMTCQTQQSGAILSLIGHGRKCSGSYHHHLFGSGKMEAMT